MAYKRNPEAIEASFQVLPNGEVVTKTGCTIHVPYRYLEHNLVFLEPTFSIVGMCGVIVGNDYSFMNVMAMISINPSSYKNITIDDIDYIEFTFPKGSTVIKTDELVKQDHLPYLIYREFYTTSILPWYCEYDDLGQVFATAAKYAGANIGQQQEVMEMVASTIARDPENRTVYYRQIVGKPGAKVTYISIETVEASTNTLSRVSGSYFNDGLIDAISHQSKKVDNIEKVLLS
jgi:hypothetical protein